MKSAALYDTFNAKYLTYQQVAETFIPNDEYVQLLGNNHSLIMGPRGCGKTTLLKMLTPAGLNFWNSYLSTNIKKEIPFTAIYIPSDIQWKSQLAFLNKHLQFQKDFNEKISDFLIATNIQMALCRTANSLVRFTIDDNRKKLLIEEEICKGLIGLWEINKPLSATFDDLELELQRRVMNVNSIINRIVFQKIAKDPFQLLPNYVFTDFFDIVKTSCKLFEVQFGYNESHRWALCFDELEISPRFLQIKLMKFLRSVDQKFLFKLTTTPLFNLENNEVEASQDNDFKTIKLWVYDDSGSKKWRTFCDHLVADRLKRRYSHQNLTPEAVFGEYNLDQIIKDELSFKGNFEAGTGKGSSTNLLFKALAAKDDSFSDFLFNRKINPKDPFSSNAEEDKSIFLKHKVTALYRFLYKSRTRKNPTIHYGVPYIYDLCDGNPRSVIGLIDEILLEGEVDSIGKKVLVAQNKQTEIILRVSKKYFNLIRNHPDSTLILRSQEFNLANDILRKIGNFIYNNIVKEDYVRSVPTTFTIDNEIDQKVIRLLEHALYLGVIVYLDPIESLSNSGLLGKRFRLTYLLTPLFRIPNRVNAEVNLKTILKVESERKNDQTEINF
jgi:hypothetical protein